MEPLASPERLEKVLKQRGITVTPEMAVLVLANASAIVRDHCGWHIAPVIEATLLVDGTGGTVLTLPTLRLVEVSAVRIDGNAVGNFVAFPRGQLYRCGTWPARPGAVEVDCRHGHETSPGNVEAVVLAIACELARGNSLRQLTVGSVSQTFDTGTDSAAQLRGAQLAGVRL
jgi:hypothetical protein